MTKTRREFLKNAGKVTAAGAIAATLPTQAQANEPSLQAQLEAVIRDLKNPPPERICGSVLDDLKTANRLAQIIGVPVEAHSVYMDERIIQSIEDGKALVRLAALRR